MLISRETGGRAQATHLQHEKHRLSQPVPPYVRRQLAALILIVLRMTTDEIVVETLDLIVTGPETPGMEPRTIRCQTVRPMMRVTKAAIV